MSRHDYLAIVCFKNASNQICKTENVHIIKVPNWIINKNCTKFYIICS